MLGLRFCSNVRDLGGHDSPYGRTQFHRFVRCGSTRSLTQDDLNAFRRWGVTHVLDLRGPVESPRLTCRFSNQSWVRWHNVPLYDIDISSPALTPANDLDNYLVSSYLHMLAVPNAIKEVFEFFSTAKIDECALFHCAAGMDRTGIVATLLLGLADVPREQIVADYARSFGTAGEVARELRCWNQPNPNEPSSYLLRVRMESIAAVYDTIVEAHGSIRAYLQSCEIHEQTLDAVRDHLVVQ